MRIIKLEDNQHYYCHLKKLISAMISNYIGSETPNMIIVRKVDDKDLAEAYANGLVMSLQ